MKSRPENPTAGDKLRAWANDRLNRIVRLDLWVAAAPRTALDLEICNRVVEELHRLTQIDDFEAEIITGRRVISVITETKATPSKKRASRPGGGSTEANSE